MKKIKFYECEKCAAEPGSPPLCTACWQRRDIVEAINELTALQGEGEPAEEKLDREIDEMVEEKCGVFIEQTATGKYHCNETKGQCPMHDQRFSSLPPYVTQTEKPRCDKCGNPFQPHHKIQRMIDRVGFYHTGCLPTEEKSATDMNVATKISTEKSAEDTNVPSKDWAKQFRKRFGIYSNYADFCPATEEYLLFIAKVVCETKLGAQLQVLDLIAEGEGWEETRDHYAEKLGLQKIYNK